MSDIDWCMIIQLFLILLCALCMLFLQETPSRAACFWFFLLFYHIVWGLWASWGEGLPYTHTTHRDMHNLKANKNVQHSIRFNCMTIIDFNLSSKVWQWSICSPHTGEVPFTIASYCPNSAQPSPRNHVTLCVRWNLVKYCTTVQEITFEKASNNWMTLKVTQGHQKCRHSVGHMWLPISGL